MDNDHFCNHSFSYPKEAPNDIRAALASEEMLFGILNIFSHTNVGQYECIGKQTWPHRKKVKCQCKTIILATLVDLPSPKIDLNKYSAPRHIGSGEEDFWRFYNIWTWRPSWSMDRHLFRNLLFSRAKEAPYENKAKLAQRLQRRSLKMLTDA